MSALVLQEQKSDDDGERYDEETVLRLVASVEQLSTHILARAIVEEASARKLSLSPASDFEEVFGKGVQGNVPYLPRDCQQRASETNGFVALAVGNRTFMGHLGISLPDSLLAERERRTVKRQMCSFVAMNGQVVGLIVLEDVPRAEVGRLSGDLKAAGIKETILLTGDGEVVAQQIGEFA